MPIKEIMRPVVSIGEKATFAETLAKMIKEKTNSIVVVDKQGKVIGLVNTGNLIRQVVPDYIEEDDIAAHFANKNIFIEDVKRARDIPVTEFMIKDPVTITPENNIVEAAVLALSNKQMRIPVVNNKKEPLGLLTRTELKKFMGEILGV